MNFSFPSKFKKIVAAVLIVAILAPSGFLLAPQKADALLVPIGDFFNTVFQVLTSVATYFGQTKEGIWDTIAWTVAKMALRQITASLVDWINSGFEGNPAFITDPAGFFLDVADQAAGDFIFGTELGFLCDPLNIGIDIRAALSLNYFGNFRQRISCRLTEVVGNVQNMHAFLSGDFNLQGRGGWTTWFSMTQVPQNNIYGAYAKAQTELHVRAVGNRMLQEKIADWGKGWKSLGCSGTRSGTAAARYYGEGGGGNCFITMPGNFVSDTITKQFGASTEALAAADEIGEMIDSVFGALMNQAFSQGLIALSSASQGQNRYTTTLRSGDPTAPFYRSSPAQQSQWSGVNSGINQQTQNMYDNAYNNQNVISQANYQDLLAGLGSASRQEPRVSYSGSFADQHCTAQGLGSGTADAAIDGQSFSYNDNSCGNEANQPGWWEVDLQTPVYLDLVEFETLSTSNSLKSWGAGPYIALFDRLGQRYRVQLPNFADNERIDLTTAQIITNVPNAPATAGEILVKRVRFEGYFNNNGVNQQDPGQGTLLREVVLFRHLNPEVNAQAVPNLLQASGAQCFDPRPTNWVTARYFPRYDRPTAMNDQRMITVVIKNQDGVIQTPASGCPVLGGDKYTLAPGNYVFEYAATDIRGFRSATTTRNVTVQEPLQPQP